MKILPHDYYSMSGDDAALMFKGWYDAKEEEKLYADWLARKQAIFIGDVTNKSFGGKGIAKQSAKAWPHPWDKKEQTVTPMDKHALRKQQAKEFKYGISRNKSNT